MKSTDTVSNQMIENKIKTAVEHASTGNFEDVLERCENLKGVIPMENTKRNNTKKYVSIAAAFVILVAAIFGITVLNRPKSVSLVSLDVNPSIMLEVDDNNEVDDVIAVNEDGKKILGDMKLENTDVDVALRAIIGSMLENGYITELANSILVSVDDDDAVRAAELEKHLVDELDKILTANVDSSNVIGQVMPDDDAAIASLAKEYGISESKAKYISSIIDDNPQLTFEKLAPLSINDISLLVSSNKVTTPQNVDQKGTASEKAYIGRDKALANALTKIGTTKDAVKGIEVDFDYDDGRMLYEVEFDFGGYDYDIDVDATTGDIVKVSKEADDDNRTTGQTGSANTAGQTNSADSTSTVPQNRYDDDDDDRYDDDDDDADDIYDDDIDD